MGLTILPRLRSPPSRTSSRCCTAVGVRFHRACSRAVWGLSPPLGGHEAELDDDRLGLAEHDRGCFPLHVADGQDHRRDAGREPVRTDLEFDLKADISAGHPSHVAQGNREMAVIAGSCHQVIVLHSSLCPMTPALASLVCFSNCRPRCTAHRTQQAPACQLLRQYQDPPQGHYRSSPTAPEPADFAAPGGSLGRGAAPRRPRHTRIVLTNSPRSL